jgi:hypothetical protein
MHSAPHRNNSDFQLRHFIAGSCYTADAAWNVMYEQKLDIEHKIAHTKANLLRREAAKIELQEKSNHISNRADQLRYDAELLEFQSSEGLIELALAGAEKELNTIKQIMDELEPLRKYSNLPLLEATEASQREEWLEELKHRAENFLLTQGTIPQDQIEAMRKHPDFKTGIIPHIKKTILLIENSQDKSNTIDLLTNKKNLIGNDND